VGWIRVTGSGRNETQTRRPMGCGQGSVYPRLTSLAVALSLLLQVLFIPYHQASRVPAVAAPDDVARIAADLKAFFGDAATLCVQSDDRSAPNTPAGHCDDACPFCRFAAQAATLFPPDTPALPLRPNAAFLEIGTPSAPDTAPSATVSQHRARAPPLVV